MHACSHWAVVISSQRLSQLSVAVSPLEVTAVRVVPLATKLLSIGIARKGNEQRASNHRVVVVVGKQGISAKSVELVGLLSDLDSIFFFFAVRRRSLQQRQLTNEKTWFWLAADSFFGPFMQLKETQKKKFKTLQWTE